MGSTILGSEQSDVLQGGQITLTNLFETFAGSGQGGSASSVTIGIAASPEPSGGQGTPVAVTSAGVLSLSASLFQYVWNVAPGQAVGDYLVTWAGTVNGVPLAYTQTVTVAAVSTGTPAPGCYANFAQYQNWSGDTLTSVALVQATLQRASEVMDHYLVGAVYAVNANGMPTDAMVIDTFMRATCAQAAFMIANNDPANVKSQYAYTSQGGMQVSRTKAAQGLVFPALAPHAAAILHAAGVLQSAALLGW